MDYTERYCLLNKIMAGVKYASIKNKSGKYIGVSLRPLTPSQSTYCDFVYDNEINLGKQYGLITRDEMLEQAKKNGIWTSEQDRLYNFYKKQIESLRKYIDDSDLDDFRKKQVEERIDGFKSKLNRLEIFISNITAGSVESVADEKYRDIMAKFIVRDSKGRRLWDNDDKIDDMVLAAGALVAYFNRDIDTKAVRELARTNPWRPLWNSAKSVGRLFRNALCECTTEQIDLMFWSRIYDSVYEHHERPDDSIINNDEALDKWFELQESKNAAGKIKDRTKGSNIWRHQDVFLVPKSKKDVEAIQGMNNTVQRMYMRKRDAVIAKEGGISEFGLVNKLGAVYGEMFIKKTETKGPTGKGGR